MVQLPAVVTELEPPLTETETVLAAAAAAARVAAFARLGKV